MSAALVSRYVAWAVANIDHLAQLESEEVVALYIAKGAQLDFVEYSALRDINLRHVRDFARIVLKQRQEALDAEKARAAAQVEERKE